MLSAPKQPPGAIPLETVEEMATICAAAGLPKTTSGTPISPARPSAASTSRRRHGRAVHGPPPGRQGHRGDDRQRCHGPVDEPPPHPHPHLRPHPKVATQRKMAMYRNVRPLLMDTSADRDTALEQAKAI